jgi:hypothetical protein
LPAEPLDGFVYEAVLRFACKADQRGMVEVQRHANHENQLFRRRVEKWSDVRPERRKIMPTGSAIARSELVQRVCLPSAIDGSLAVGAGPIFRGPKK